MAFEIGKAECFEPVARGDARVLILGCLPGKVSLERGEYYAFPRNAFWEIMGRLTGASPDLPYPQRLLRLTEKGVALWDVCAEGLRPGSLDSSIRASSVKINDFSAFLTSHEGVRLICFNGSKAEQLYRSRVRPSLPPELAVIRTAKLPSTSPAHAQITIEQKLACWRETLAGEIP